MKILVFGKVWPEPSSSAAGKRMQQLIALLQQRGTVYFVCASNQTGNEIDLESIGVVANTIHLNDDSVDDYLKNLQPDVVIFDRFITEEQYAWRVIEQCPNAVRILNTEDIHFLRKTRQDWVKKEQKVAPSWRELDLMNNETKRELAAIYRSDWTIIISPEEFTLLEQEVRLPAESLVYLPLFYEKRVPHLRQNRNGFLFIGNALHEPNSDAIRVLYDVIWPKIKAQLLEAVLYLAVAYPTSMVQQLHQPKKGVFVLQHEKELEKIYQSICVSLVPLRFGAGVKGKIIEAMEFSIPFVTTSIGAEGLFLNPDFNELITDDWGVFSQRAIELYLDEEKREDYTNKGAQHLQQFFDKTQHEVSFLTAFDELMSTYLNRRKKNYFSAVIQHQSVMSTRYLSKWIMEKNKTNE